MSAAGRHPLVPQVRAICLEIAHVATTLDDFAVDSRIAATIQAEVERIDRGAAGVVVAGEKKRGKSSLVNALIGHPDLLPVGVDVATSVHLAVGYAAEPRAEAVVVSANEPVPIELSEIASYAALDPETGEEIRDDVRHVRVCVPSPLLRAGIVIMDTPGVGGLVSGHAQITQAALSNADALMFVVNGSSELTRSELTFLEHATERIATVLFVLTQIDKHAGWREILERDRQLLATHAPRYSDAPWFAVSSRAELAAIAARDRSEPEKAERHAAASGFATLREALTAGVAGYSQQIRMRNALHLALPQAERLTAEVERQIRSLKLDPEVKDEIARLQERLRELSTEGAQWRRKLSSSVRELKGSLTLDFQRSVNDLHALIEEKITTTSAKDLVNELPGDLESGIQSIWMELNLKFQSEVEVVIAEMGRQFGELDVEITRGLTLPDRLRSLSPVARSTSDTRGALALIERVVPGWRAGSLVAGALSIVTSGVVLPILGGFGLTALLSGLRKRREELRRARGDTTRYTGRVISDLRTEIPPQITRTLDELNERIGEMLSKHILLERQRLENELERHQKYRHQSQEELNRKLQNARASLAKLRDLTKRGAAARTELED